MDLCLWENINKYVLKKHFVVQHFILIMCNSHVQEIDEIFVKSKWINIQMNIYATHITFF